MDAEQLELAWAAGFFDGEGCTTLGQIKKLAFGAPKTYLYPKLTVSQKDPRPLARFVEAVGEGRLRGQGQRIHNWSVMGAKAHVVMSKLYPYLSAPKREQWNRVLEAAAS